MSNPKNYDKMIEKIKELRNVKGLSQEQLAWDANINRGYYARIESKNSVTNITFDTFNKICNILDISWRDFFNDPRFK